MEGHREGNSGQGSAFPRAGTVREGSGKASGLGFWELEKPCSGPSKRSSPCLEVKELDLL